MRGLVLGVAILALSAATSSAQAVYPRYGYAPFVTPFVGYRYAQGYGYARGYHPRYYGCYPRYYGQWGGIAAKRNIKTARDRPRAAGSDEPLPLQPDQIDKQGDHNHDCDEVDSIHRPQSSSASRLTAGAFGFLALSQSGDRPRR